MGHLFSPFTTQELHEAYRDMVIPGFDEFEERLEWRGRITTAIRDLNELHASPLCDQFDEHLQYRSRLEEVIRELDELYQALCSVPLQRLGQED